MGATKLGGACERPVESWMKMGGEHSMGGVKGRMQQGISGRGMQPLSTPPRGVDRGCGEAGRSWRKAGQVLDEDGRGKGGDAAGNIRERHTA